MISLTRARTASTGRSARPTSVHAIHPASAAPASTPPAIISSSRFVARMGGRACPA
ncbi:hypothetical protein [Nonomuraea rubra]|uniref:Uncharacterized protein n=1 Tax=Nonomuraea rubra TaxID=46180 RepID=A0A7X0NXC7_9ACTN|nr:hypothetical protein [Nonomuraea rubra]MBB6551378.1 hypothetical protein [Nonomuraea rubra]